MSDTFITTLLWHYFWPGFVGALLFYGLCIIFETALVSAAAPRLKASERKKAFGAARARKIIERRDRNVAISQGFVVLSSAICFVFFLAFSSNYLSALPLLLQVVFSLFSLVLTYLKISFLSVRLVDYFEANRILSILSWPYSAVSWLLYPLTLIALLPAYLLDLLLGPKPEKPKTAADLSLVVAGTDQEVELDEEEKEMIQGVCEFGETVAREVMTPRTDFVVIPLESSFEEVVALIKSSGFSRFPVIEDRVDNVVGILMARDLMDYVASYIEAGKSDFSVRSVMRDAYFIPNTKVIDDLLAEFKKRKQHMAVVLDEHGGVDGLVTLEDLIEEIVGEIFDESDLPEPEILEKGEGEVLLDGGVTVDELNEKFSLSIPEGDYDTVAGYLLSELGRMPVQGDLVSLMKGEVKEGEGEGVKLGELSVDKLEGHRIESVKLVLTQADESEEIEVGN